MTERPTDNPLDLEALNDLTDAVNTLTKAVEALTMRLDDLPEDVREAVVEGIGQLGHDDTTVDAIHAIADGLRDDDPEPDDDKNAS